MLHGSSERSHMSRTIWLGGDSTRRLRKQVINTQKAGFFLLLRKTQTLDMGNPIKRISVLSPPSTLRST
jgi:hypothetical protein